MTLHINRSLFFSFLLLCSVQSLAQDYYVVIGSFAIENAAVKFTGYARNLHYDASYILNESNNLYYVYILKTQDRKLASELTIRLQKETEFQDAWMYFGKETRPAEVSLIKEQEVVSPVLAEPPVPVEEALDVDEKPEEKPPITFDGPTKPVARGKFFVFKLYTAEGKEIPGQLFNVDRQQARDLATYRANEYVDVLRPATKDTPLTIVCEIFGYKEVVKLIDYNDPGLTEGVVLDENGAWVVPYTLERLNKGNVSVMYNVTFYKEAVIMLPKSKTELDELVNMMKLNPNYKIKIHGHANGNEKGIRIIMLGADKNYFGMARSLSKVGSTKELSRLRAETIKSYLVDHGIDGKRIETQAWGGMVMLAKPETAIAARINNRIEIEILED